MVQCGLSLCHEAAAASPRPLVEPTPLLPPVLLPGRVSNVAPLPGKAPRPWNDLVRIQFLRSLGILDTPDDSALDQVTQLCCRLLGTGIACVVLVDAERSWVKSLAGYDATQKANPALRTASRETTICSWVVAASDPKVLVVPDASKDARFCNFPHIAGPPHVRFYAGAPLVAANGLHLGALCVIDLQPRQLDAGACNLLANLASLTARQLEAPALAEFEKQVEAGELLLGRCDGDACAPMMRRPPQ